ncbi:AsnC family transcriptional regulator [Pedobacter sp. HMWF019]|uniref:Lrp/AsnC family transcriptional regulator n=1 Tax=Pedobacter sp. HMWF019 TaxID=2056856 RepID=UPI000D35E587|nr:Lrp/AsnC family transcriptional regulator [Pedobacter sp. HMWF019]PTS96337.1 AsnC family transcriptional regulator [Pedobacter sp. HMWF019]
MNISTLDETDKGILNLLQKDAHLTIDQLAKQLKKSKTPIFQRMKRLKELGYIKAFVALLAQEKINPLFIAFPHIHLTSHTEAVLRQFQDQVTQFPEVLECYHLTGNVDFMLKIVLPDMHAYNNFLREKLASLPNIGNVHSYLVLSQAKHDTAFPL